MRQLSLFPDGTIENIYNDESYIDRLVRLLSHDLSFQSDDEHLSHKAHSFPAKFPPALPRKFINSLTQEDDLILDPMMGSGTTVVEAMLLNRRGLGFDIDPLALLMAKVKACRIEKSILESTCISIIQNARNNILRHSQLLEDQISLYFDANTREFVNYWFAHETQLELMALMLEILEIENELVRDFCKLVFSSLIITKAGGVSLAFDLAHTRPHKAKVVISKSGKMVVGEGLHGNGDHRVSLLTKTLRSPLEEFARKFRQNLRGVIESAPNGLSAVGWGSVACLPLQNNSVDLIVTSPPYASNAIDYMRAHKFSLVWLGYSIDELTRLRKTYIGSDNANGIVLKELPESVQKLVDKVANINPAKGKSLHRYFSEMSVALEEMFRVLKPHKAAIVVVGNSILAGQDTQVQDCLVKIGERIGFQIPGVGIRQLDRNRRMLPTGINVNKSSQIQQRMHEEYVIGFYKA